GLINNRAQLCRARSRHPAGKLLQVESFPGYLAQLCFQNLCTRSFVRKIDAELEVKSALPDQRLVEAIQSIGGCHEDKPADRTIMIDCAHQTHGDVVELPASATGITHGVLPSRPERINLIDEEENRPSGNCLRKLGADVFCGCSNPAGEQLWSRDVFEIKAEFARSRSSQKGFGGSWCPVHLNAVSYEAVSFVFSRVQLAFHHLADLPLRIVQAADVGKPLGRDGANHGVLLYLWPRRVSGCGNGSDWV